MSQTDQVRERLVVLQLATGQESPDLAADVLAGLAKDPKELHFLYFYDQEGSLLFERICELPEYYLTRCEAEILLGHADEIAELSLGSMELVELGSGSSSKTRILIEALLRKQGGLHYCPIDISTSMLLGSSRSLLQDYPNLSITAYAAEYNTGIHRISETDFEQKMVLWLGSNVGNLKPRDAVAFLSKIRSDLNPQDFLLIGADLRKERATLEAAYDDSEGVTAEFNKNLLRRINRELGGRFDPRTFRHLAFWNPALSRVEMHLQSLRRQEVTIEALGRSFQFSHLETIHTENSYKYSLEQLDEICAEAGLTMRSRYLDSGRRFSVNLLAPS